MDEGMKKNRCFSMPFFQKTSIIYFYLLDVRRILHVCDGGYHYIWRKPVSA